MSEIRKIISENLIATRKSFKLTQLELSNQLGYSDKAISRWEKGEVCPDVETLEKLSKLYGVPIEYFFTKHNVTNNYNIQKNLILYEILSIVIIWTIATTLFIFIQWNQDIAIWPIFVAGAPCSAGCMLYFNDKYFNNPLYFTIELSVFCWSLITTLFCFLNFETVKTGSWLFFILGVPIQLVIIVLYFLKKNK